MSTAEAKILESRAIAAYKDYSEEFKASIVQAIENNGGNVNGTAKLFNLPRDTVNYWWRHSGRFVELQQSKPRELADKLENIAHNLADSIEDHDLSIVQLTHKATALGIAIEKMQLLRGAPTSISEQVDRQELTIILSSALSAGAIDVEGQVIEPETERITDGTV